MLDPLLHVAPPIADMSAHSETGRPFSPVTPLVEGGDGDTEVFAKLLNGEEPVPVFHAFNHPEDPVDSIPFVSKGANPGFSKGFMTLC